MTPLQIAPGFASIEAEFEQYLCRAFRRAKLVIVPRYRSRFLMECMGYGFDQGWVVGEIQVDETGWPSEVCCRLTGIGRYHFDVVDSEQEWAVAA